MDRVRLLITVLLGAIAAGSALAAPPKLSAYGADAQQVSVSGLSSGAFMAVQLQVAYSRSFIGSGVIAGGPYYCAANNVLFAGVCMGQVNFFPPNPKLMIDAAKSFAAARRIDPLGNLRQRRIYIFSGIDDNIVRQPAVDAAVAFFQGLGVAGDKLKYVNNIPAGHAVITPNHGNDCAANAAPYISHCSIGSEAYDQAGELLRHIHGQLNPRADVPAGEIIAFNQRRYAPASTGMADTGYLYVPRTCAAGERCPIHIALHGCMQAAESVGKQFYTDTGYNNWADSNNILVLYPQVNKSNIPFNPKGCWDWWGYTGSNYAVKSGVQMKAIVAMVKRLTH